VRHLPAADAQRLPTFALCLARLRRWDIQLHVFIVDALLSLFNASTSA
jgi:hypothetical protein